MSRFIVSASGIRIDPANPDSDKIDLVDIAIGLARQPRFNRQTRVPYNVAQHSVMVAEIIAHKYYFGELTSAYGNKPNELCAAGLFHDASEAYIGDIIAPLKALLPDYKALEEKWMYAIAERFGLSPELFSSHPVKNGDMLAFSIEVHCLCRDCTDYGFSEQTFGIHAKDTLKQYPVLQEIDTPWDEAFSMSSFLNTARILEIS